MWVWKYIKMGSSFERLTKIINCSTFLMDLKRPVWICFLLHSLKVILSLAKYSNSKRQFVVILTRKFSINKKKLRMSTSMPLSDSRLRSCYRFIKINGNSADYLFACSHWSMMANFRELGELLLLLALVRNNKLYPKVLPWKETICWRKK